MAKQIGSSKPSGKLGNKQGGKSSGKRAELNVKASVKPDGEPCGENVNKGHSSANREERVRALRGRIEARIRDEFGISAHNATLEQAYRAVALCVRDDAAQLWSQGREESQGSGEKCMVYLSAEYLIGRAFTNNLINLGVHDDYAAALLQMGIEIDKLEEQEPAWPPASSTAWRRSNCRR